MEKLGLSNNTKEAKIAYKKLLKQVNTFLSEIEAQLRPTVIRVLLYFLQKVFQRVYD